MTSHWLPISFFIATFFALRGIALLAHIALTRARPVQSQPSSHAKSLPLPTLVILGSGGHTAEMMSVMDRIDRQRYTPITFVRAATDANSEARVARKEAEKQHATEPVYLQIPRSREVGQSYVSSVRTTLVALLHAVRIINDVQPQIILCNGPGTGVPLCVAAFLARVFLFRPCRIVFIESFCRVQSLSMTGIMLYPIVDEFVVQWPQLDANACASATPTTTSAEERAIELKTKRKGWRGVKYIGRLC